MDRINKHKAVLYLVGIMNLIIFFIQVLNSYVIKEHEFMSISFFNLIAGLISFFIIFNINKKIKYLSEKGFNPIYKTKFKDWTILFRFSIFILVITLLYIGLNIMLYIVH